MTSGDQDQDQLVIGQEVVEDVTSFTYLGSIVASDRDAEADVRCRIGRAATVFKRMTSIWSSKAITTRTKIRLYSTLVLPTAIYAAETWKLTYKIAHKLNVLHQCCLRKILHISYRDRVTNEEVLRRAEQHSLQAIVTERRLRLAGHMLRMPEERLAKTAMMWTPSNGKRKRGRPKKTWRSAFKDLKLLGLTWEQAERAQERQQWQLLAAQCAILQRRT